jgi:Ca2+/Na+ antiporter
MNMEEKDIIKIWKKGYNKSNNDKPITMETIEILVKSRARKVTGKIRWDLYFSLVLYILGSGITAYAAVLYQSHTYLKWILPGGFFLLILLIIQNIVLIRKHQTLKAMDISLRDRVSGIIRYFSEGYRLWQLVYPLGMMIMVLSVSLLVEYTDGSFRINHPFEFVAVMVIMYIFIYFPMRYTRNVYLQDLENCLKNLDEQEYSSIQKTFRRYRIFILIFAIGLALLVLGSLVAWYYYSGKMG